MASSGVFGTFSGWESFAPQFPQKLSASATSASHFGHLVIARERFLIFLIMNHITRAITAAAKIAVKMV